MRDQPEIKILILSDLQALNGSGCFVLSNNISYIYSFRAMKRTYILK
jgi:hypothetical protein